MAALVHGGVAMAASVAWIPAGDEQHVTREGYWYESRFRYAPAPSLASGEDGAALTVRFEGTGLVLRLGAHAAPAYGWPNLGDLAIRIDDGPERVIHPVSQPREVILARDLPRGEHVARVEHRVCARGMSCRVEAFGVISEPSGDLAFNLTGRRNAFLVDARARLSHQGQIVRDCLVRNWLTGQCRIAGLPPGEGYRLEVQAIGWEPAVIESIAIEPGAETVLPPIHLLPDPATEAHGFRFPALGRQVARRPGESFRTRFAAHDSEIIGAHLERTVGPATISRPLAVVEDEAAAFYYDREIVATIAGDTPRGLYDLVVALGTGEHDWELRSPRAVMVVDEYPTDPVFMTWGHLDTWGQYQAEYLQHLADIANLLAADMVLNANAVNPAYISGALSRLQMPHVVTFGNHQFPGHERWYGRPVSAIDLGPDVRVLNFGLPWHEDISQAEALLAQTPEPRIAVINGFEHNAPIDFLDRHRVALIHDGHGPGRRVMEMGATPTLRVGKVNAQSFRVIRFRDGRVVSCTYMGHETAPIPFPRGATPPLRVSFDPPADGTHSEVRATLTNDLEEAYPDCRVTAVMPAGRYACDGGRIERQTDSDCGQFTVVSVRTEAPASSQAMLRVRSVGR